MSHISKMKIKGLEAVHPLVLEQGIKVACQLLGLQGLQVTDHIYDWGWNKVQSWDGLRVICGLGSEKKKFRGVGLAVDKDGKLALIGDFFRVQDRVDHLRKQVEQVLGGACYFAARAMIARAKGQKAEVRVNNETRQLQLVVSL